MSGTWGTQWGLTKGFKWGAVLNQLLEHEVPSGVRLKGSNGELFHKTDVPTESQFFPHEVCCKCKMGMHHCSGLKKLSNLQKKTKRNQIVDRYWVNCLSTYLHGCLCKYPSKARSHWQHTNTKLRYTLQFILSGTYINNKWALLCIVNPYSFTKVWKKKRFSFDLVFRWNEMDENKM